MAITWIQGPGLAPGQGHTQGLGLAPGQGQGLGQGFGQGQGQGQGQVVCSCATAGADGRYCIHPLNTLLHSSLQHTLTPPLSHPITHPPHTRPLSPSSPSLTIPTDHTFTLSVCSIKMWVGRAVPIASLSGGSLGSGVSEGTGGGGKGGAAGGGSRGGVGMGNAFIWTWSCSYSFRHREDSPVRTLSSSLDGSLLAAGYDNVVTLWDPVSVTLRTSLIAPGVAKNQVQSPPLIFNIYPTIT